MEYRNVRETHVAHQQNLKEETIANRIVLWEEVNREDREELERMKIGLASEHALSSLLAEDDYESIVRDFQHWRAAQDRRHS